MPDQRPAATEPSGLSIVIPAFNEEGRLPRALEEIERYQATFGRPLEIVVCDDGSSDGTSALVQARLAQLPYLRLITLPHRGKGSAVRAGMLAARMPYAMLCDADFSMPVEELGRFVEALDSGCQIAIGSREGPGARRFGEPVRRHIMGRVFNTIVKLIVVPGISDTQCGFKGFQRSVAQDLFSHQHMDGFSFDAEILFIARKRGYSMRQVGINWYFNDDSRVRAVTDTLSMTLDLLRIRYLDLRGSYRRAGRSSASAKRPE